MSDFNPFDMDLNGDVDGMDFLGFDCLLRHALDPPKSEDDPEELEMEEDDHQVSSTW